MIDPAEAYERELERRMTPLDSPPSVVAECDHSKDPCPRCGHYTERDPEDDE